MSDELASDGLPLDYQDESGMWWVMCACGHRVGGSPRPGDKIALCVNCRFMASMYGGSFPIVYPDRVPPDGLLTLEGDHPDHIAEREWRTKDEARRAKARAKRHEKKEAMRRVTQVSP